MVDKLNNRPIMYKIKEKSTRNSTNKRVFQLLGLCHQHNYINFVEWTASGRCLGPK